VIGDPARPLSSSSILDGRPVTPWSCVWSRQRDLIFPGLGGAVGVPAPGHRVRGPRPGSGSQPALPSPPSRPGAGAEGTQRRPHPPPWPSPCPRSAFPRPGTLLRKPNTEKPLPPHPKNKVTEIVKGFEPLSHLVHLAYCLENFSSCLRGFPGASVSVARTKT
jgi:hypothetical protein